jgi:hypothetical protein
VAALAGWEAHPDLVDAAQDLERAAVLGDGVGVLAVLGLGFGDVGPLRVLQAGFQLSSFLGDVRVFREPGEGAHSHALLVPILNREVRVEERERRAVLELMRDKKPDDECRGAEGTRRGNDPRQHRGGHFNSGVVEVRPLNVLKQPAQMATRSKAIPFAFCSMAARGKKSRGRVWERTCGIRSVLPC